MPAITIRSLSEETHRALELRAARHGTSIEAEILAILENAVKPAQGLGSALASFSRHLGGADLDLKRDPVPIKPAKFK
jgi:plasmid stability protein